MLYNLKVVKLELIVRAIVVNNGKILLCQNLKHGYYFLPGGHIEEGESPEQTFRREMLEEVGIAVKNIIQIAEVKNSYTEEEEQYNETIYVCLASLENYENIKSLESHITFAWIPVAEFNSADFKPEKAKGDILKAIEANKDFWIS